MTSSEKLAAVKTILRIDDSSEDYLLTSYLNIAGREIIGWRYSYSSSAPQDVPAEFEMVQVQAVVNGYTQSGIEGQVLSIEHGIHRRFEYSDMISYIRAHVIPIAGTV